MPTFVQLTSALDQAAWANHDYGFALSCIREVLRGYRGAKSQLGRIRDIVLRQSYADLAAAFDAEDVLKGMDRVSTRIFAGDDARRTTVDPEGRSNERWETLTAVRWLRSTVEQAGSIDLTTLTTLADEEDIKKVKSRLNWMARAGTVHLVEEVVHAGPSPESQFVPTGTELNGVPRFRAYHLREQRMDDAQLSFYREFERRYRSGERVELEGQWSYAFALIEKLEDELEGNLPALRELYERLDRDYPDSPLDGLGAELEVDRLFKIGDWQGGFDLLWPEIPIDIYLTLTPVVVEKRLQVATVERWTTEGLKTTASFRDRSAAIDAALQDLLDAAHENLGRSIVVDLWQRLIVERAAGAPAPVVASEFGGFITQDKIDDYLLYHDRALEQRSAPRLELPGSPWLREWPAPYCDTYWFEQIVRARLQSLYRDAENIVRREAGIPRVGEGWVSEVLLLTLVREAFPKLTVVHQGRPYWLGQQSLDIYLPDQNIGVEYQGAQHSGPVKRFGGALAYRRQLERDARKRALCLANGCELIEVYPGYDLDAVMSQIQEAVGRDKESDSNVKR